MVAKYIIKNSAMEAGRTATFLPKPVADEAGSGMHVHMQLFRDGQPIFYDENGYGQLSDTALWFIGGLLKHAASLCAITNPSTNFDLPEEEKAKIGGLPKSLEEALDALEKDHDYLTQGGVFPQRLLDIWVEKKRKEISKINRVPHPMEYAMYYDL